MATILLALVGLIIDIFIIGCIAFVILMIPIYLICKFLGWLFKWD